MYSHFDPFPQNMSLQEILLKKLRFFRWFVLFTGIVSMINSILIFIGIDVFIIGTTEISYLASSYSINFVKNNDVFVGILLLIVCVLYCCLYIVMGMLSKSKKRISYMAVLFFMLDCFVMFMNFNSGTMSSLIGHTLGCIICIKGIFDTRRYTKFEKEYLDKDEMTKKPFNPYPFM